jgi:putative membrane protein
MPAKDTPATDRTRSPSRVRDQLANERTYLAWVRTALGLIGLGFVLARMGLFLQQMTLVGGQAPTWNPRGSHEFMIIGMIFLVVGTVLSGWTGWLYHRTRRAIDEDRYEPATATVGLLTAVVVAGGLSTVGLMLWRTWTPG